LNQTLADNFLFFFLMRPPDPRTDGDPFFPGSTLDATGIERVMPMDELKGSPYVLDDEAAQGLRKAIQALEERCRNLRASGTLTEETLSAYYGRKRFEQVAESNALEGSTLSVGETELAIMKGVTLTGHDPAYVRDARNLARALDRLVELAREKRPTNFEDVHEIHALILGDRPGAGVFRNEPVRIAGAAHHPPPDWEGVMSEEIKKK
jgi:hypothetical protein